MKELVEEVRQEEMTVLSLALVIHQLIPPEIRDIEEDSRMPEGERFWVFECRPRSYSMTYQGVQFVSTYVPTTISLGHLVSCC